MAMNLSGLLRNVVNGEAYGGMLGTSQPAPAAALGTQGQTWYTPSNPGETLTAGDASPEFATDYDKLFAGDGVDWDLVRRLGYQGNVPVDGGTGEGAGPYQPGNPRQELFDWMRSGGYTYAVQPTYNGGQKNVWLDPQGQPVAGSEREVAAPNDGAFWNAAMLAGAGITAGIGTGYLGGSGAAGTGAGAGGSSLAGSYGGAGALGDASLLTGGSLGTVAQPAAGLTYGGSALGGGLSAAGAGLTGGGTPSYLAEGALTPMEVPSQAWQNPTTPEIATPETLSSNAIGTLPSSPGGTSGGLLNSLTSNPRLIAGLAGGLLGGAGAEGGGGYSYDGPMPTITRGGWSPTATPTYSQPAAAPRLNLQPGQANSGLWRYMLGGGQ